MTLYQLRCNVLVKDLGYQFCLHLNFVSPILTTWINFLYEQTCCLTKNNITTEGFSAEPDTRASALSSPLGVYSFLKRSKMQDGSRAVSISNKCTSDKSQSEVRLHTRRSVHFQPSQFTRPSFSNIRGSGSKTRCCQHGVGRYIVVCVHVRYFHTFFLFSNGHCCHGGLCDWS